MVSCRFALQNIMDAYNKPNQD